MLFLLKKSGKFGNIIYRIGDVMKNKGFTLIEILGVILVLGIIGMIIYPKVAQTIENSRQNSYKIYAKRLVDTLNSYALDKKATLILFDGCSFNFDSNTSDCLELDYSGELPSGGSIEVDTDGVVDGIISFDDYNIVIQNSNLIDAYKSTVAIGTTYVFNYTGGEQTFTVKASGYYKLEVWGASGASSGGSGGSGGYSTGKVNLSYNDKLYIVVGKAGEVTNGGYNGGGNGSVSCSTGNAYKNGGGGGGATHIALGKNLGELKNYSSDKGSILIVAGGGGGGAYISGNYSGGAGGGFVGNSGIGRSINPTGGNQQTSYAFGLGQNGGACYSSNWGESGRGGGGGGFYGGTASQTGQNGIAGGAGGSGYIGNDLLSDKAMYCYSCTESSAYATKTISTALVSENAVENNAKIGDGYARITYIGKVKD